MLRVAEMVIALVVQLGFPKVEHLEYLREYRLAEWTVSQMVSIQADMSVDEMGIRMVV